MDNRLVIIEGLPCSGKSTATRYAADVIGAQKKVCWSDEGSGRHPADWEFHAFLSEDVLAESFSPDEQQRIRSCSEQLCNGHAVPLSQFDGELQGRLMRYKIYDALPWDIEKPVMLEKWRSFVNNSDEDTVYVFNCVMLQNPMCETMMRFGFSEDASFGYISEIADIIRPLKPLVIYLSNDDIAETVMNVAKERDGWLEQVIDYHINGAYGKSIGASGFDGYIACLEERQRRELDILSKISADSLVISNAHRDWSAAYKLIKDRLI